MELCSITGCRYEKAQSFFFRYQTTGPRTDRMGWYPKQDYQHTNAQLQKSPGGSRSSKSGQPLIRIPRIALSSYTSAFCINYPSLWYFVFA